MSSNGKGKVMTLAEMAARTPPVDAAEAHRRALETRLYESIGPADVEAWLEKLKELAGKGNLKAINSLLQLVTRRPAAPQSVTQQAVVFQRVKSEDQSLFALLESVATGGPAGSDEAARRAGLSPATANRLLAESGWFDREPDGWHLSAAGRLAWNAERDRE